MTDTASTAEPAESDANPGFLGRWQYTLAVVFTAGWTVVICAGLFVQFVNWEYPCPLCMLQRMFMGLAALGGAFIIRQATRGTITPRDYAKGFGLAVVACVIGGFTSWRQTMLHILPGDKGYGDTVLGLHMYVWAWILFVIAILVIGVTSSLSTVTTSTAPLTAWQKRIGYVAVVFFLVVMAVNAIAVFAEAGFHWYLPDDPVRYQLFYDLGILD
ncbi:disulfide bond formation protein B [Gordonia sp. (in: high G+C Gram-positive bacteria)]|uniref:disulfide bond formation protein B n=1 Tax=Gordonia sp. (in: high G+C Gram-positive bacteria) TaxID=84139 RepID=UPI0016A9C1CF|nr:disulfide bond formation protein B [Gordonia sp. (in: high G+C Gram-positive bacteria)]NLG46218.1 disulfide bond formation protein B [Gordonia sp. (in: high G+C Gram-positive bacteria)]